MHIVYITEPAWFERAIPSWIQSDLHVVVTESDTVVNEAMIKKIEVLPLGQRFRSEQSTELLKESIMQEFKIRNRLGKLLYPDYFLSELIHGFGDILFHYNRLLAVISGLFKLDNHFKITFVYGDRYRAWLNENPKGGWLAFLILSRECKTRGICINIRSFEFMNKRELSNNRRYDRYFSASTTDCTSQVKYTKMLETFNSQQDNVLFLYLYEMCKDDLEPLVNPKMWPENCGILTGRLSRMHLYQFPMTLILQMHQERIMVVTNISTAN